jgi:hypothetical protein
VVHLGFVICTQLACRMEWTSHIDVWLSSVTDGVDRRCGTRIRKNRDSVLMGTSDSM